MQSIDSIDISTRFSEAWNIVTAEWGSKARFFEKYGIDKRNFTRALKDMDHHHLDVSWIAAVVIEFKISADWILTGRGEMSDKY